MRDNMNDKKFYRFYNRMYWLVSHLVCPILAIKYRFSGEKIPSGVGPRFILCNHNTDFDFLFLTYKSKEPIDFVVTESILRMGPIARWAGVNLRPILHDKGSKGVSTLKDITGRIKEGRSVLLFPEGNRSFDGRTGEVSTAIGKIAAMTGATIVIYKLTGGYFTTPRWGRGVRKGKITGSVVRTITPEELKSMTKADIQKAIEEGIYTDAYAEQEACKIRFKSPNRAEYLETLLFRCPSCKKIGTLTSSKNMISCSCGYSFTLDEFGYLWNENNESMSITEAFEEQKKSLCEALKENEETLLWQDEVELLKLNADHCVLEERKATLMAYPDHIMVGDRLIRHSEISSVDVVQRNRLSIHENKALEHYEFHGEETFNAVKYLIWFERSFA